MNEAIAALCHRALCLEVDATPKPGLVDRRNNGAHTDMNHALFHTSADALLPYFRAVANAGAQTAALPAPQALRHMRPLGLEAEQAMYAATGGINTHKGAIFSLGLLAAATARLISRAISLSPARIATAASEYVADICARELESKTPATKGGRAYLQYGARGARGQAQAGFPAILEAGLPRYRACKEAGAADEHALIEALLAMMQTVPDTNVLTRKNEEAAHYVHTAARQFLQRGLTPGSAPWHAALCALDDAFILQNISPGGCADLAACTYYLYECVSLTTQ